MIDIQSKLDIQEAQESILSLKSNLELFHNYIYRNKYGDKFTRAGHIKQWADLIKKHILTDEDKRGLIITTSPRVGKTSFSMISLPLFLIMNNPDLNIVGLTYDETLAKTHGIEIRNAFDVHHDLLGLSISNLKRSTSEFKFNDNKTGKLTNGSIRIIGRNTSLTGTRFDIAILDDVINPTKLITKGNTQSENLEEVIEWYNNVLLDRIDIDTKVLITHTRFGRNDLIGYLTSDEKYKNSYVHYNFPAINPDGSWIYPEKYPKEFFLNKQKENHVLFETRYQGVPIDDVYTGFFPDNFKEFTDEIPNTEYSSFDLAFTANKTSKFTSMITGGIIDDKFVITNLDEAQTTQPLRWIMLNNVSLKNPIADSNMYKPQMLIEKQPAGAGIEMMNTWDERLQQEGFVPPIWIAPNRSKELRATFMQEFIRAKRLVFHESLIGTDKYANYVSKVKSFPAGEFSDYVDATSQALNNLFNMDNGSFGILTDDGFF